MEQQVTSADSVLLDTHVWFKYQVSPKELRTSAVTQIEEAATRGAVYVSAISVWELALLEKAGKVEMIGGVQRWVDRALSKPGIHLLPLSPEIAIETVYLPPPMHKDPADRILVASARVERMRIATSDKAVLTFAKSSGLPYLRA